MDCFPLLLAGTATSTKRRGESVSQKATVGMLTYDDSLRGCKSELIRIFPVDKDGLIAAPENQCADR